MNKSVEEQVSQILSELSIKELSDFIKEITKKDEGFRELFLARYTSLKKQTGKKFYQDQVRRILRPITIPNSFDNPSIAIRASLAINELLDTAEDFRKEKKHLEVFHIVSVVAEELTKKINKVDDSHGGLSSCIYRSLDMLQVLVDNPILPEGIRKQLLSYVIKAYEKEVFEGWDWHIFMLDLAVQLVERDKEIQKVKDLLQNVKRDKYNLEFYAAQAFMYSLIIKEMGKDAAHKFMIQNLENNLLRSIGIEQAIQLRNYPQAIAWAEEGIEQDAEKRPGLVYDWKRFLYRIYKETDNQELAVSYARDLLRNDFFGKRDYYTELKMLIPKEKWPEFVEELLEELHGNHHFRTDSLIERIYIEEKMWSRLLQYVKLHIGVEHLGNYEEYLLGDYREELIDIYFSSIQDYLQRNVGRKYYRRAVKYIKHIKLLGSPEKALELKHLMLEKYKNRPSLIEEFDKI